MTPRRPPAPELPLDRSDPARRIVDVISSGDRRAILEAVRDRLGFETDDNLWQRHKAECVCTCGMGDGRLLVALTKELRAVLAELAGLPDEGEGKSDLDKLDDELAGRRATRRAAPAS